MDGYLCKKVSPSCASFCRTDWICDVRGVMTHLNGWGLELKPSVYAKVLYFSSSLVCGLRALEMLKPQRMCVMLMKREFSARVLPGQIRRPCLFRLAGESAGAEKEEVTYPAKSRVSIAVRISFKMGAKRGVFKVPLGHKFVRPIKVFLVVVDCPKIAQDSCSFGDEEAVVVVVLGVCVRSSTHNSHRSPAKGFFDDSPAVREVPLILPARRTIPTDHGVEFLLRSCRHAREACHSQHKAHQRGRARVTASPE